MSVTSVDSNLETLTLTLVADFAAPGEKVWDLWADPRQLEQWWGPPTYPATFEEYDLSPGGDARYFMTGPEGDRHYGWWRFTDIQTGTGLEFHDGFADADRNPVESMPVTLMTVRIGPHDAGTRMELRSRFETLEQMEKMAEMGMVEGLGEAVAQMDALLGTTV